VPFFVSWSGKLPAGKTYDQPVSAMDILPTACAVTGAPQPNGVEGVNLLPHLKGEVTTAPHDILAWRFGPQKAIRQGNWKLVDVRDMEAKTQSGWQLYDLSTDIGEQHDLAATKPELVTQLSKAWDDWNAKNMAPQWHGSINEDPTAPQKAAPKAGKAKKK